MAMFESNSSDSTQSIEAGESHHSCSQARFGPAPFVAHTSPPETDDRRSLQDVFAGEALARVKCCLQSGRAR